MIVLYGFIVAGLVLSGLGTPYALWIFNQAREDERIFANDPEEWRLTSLLRKRNTGATLVCTAVYLISGLMVLGLTVTMSVGGRDTRQWRDAFVALFFIVMIRGLVVQAVLLWISYTNKGLRLRLNELRTIRERKSSRREDVERPYHG